MAEQPLARAQPREPPARTIPAVPAEAGGAVIPAEHCRSAPPAFQALDEGTLRDHFAPMVFFRGWWKTGLAAEFERAARLPGLAATHPLQPPQTVQGILEVAHEVARSLAAITGLESFSLQAASAADAQRAALLVARAAFERTRPERREVVAPADSATLGLADALGLRPRAAPRLPGGELDLDGLLAAVGDATLVVVAGWLKPSGDFDPNIAAAADVAHAHGALMCLEARGWWELVGTVRARDVGADLAWLELHELTPLAPGAALGVRSELTEALPAPLVGKERRGYILDGELPRSIGRLAIAPFRFPQVLAVYLALRAAGGTCAGGAGPVS